MAGQPPSAQPPAEPPYAVNLLVNGDFEEGSPMGNSSYYQISPDNSTATWLAGWEVIYNPYNPDGNGGDIEVVGQYWGKVRDCQLEL